MYTIAVVDYGMGNLHSVAKALERVAVAQRVQVTYDPDEIMRADKVVFPGVGGIGYCMGELERLGLDEAVREVSNNKPLLGICVGMQSMLDHSEENDGHDALGLFHGRVTRFEDGQRDPISNERLKVPQMGWNKVAIKPEFASHPMWEGIKDGTRFYFVHSYYVTPDDQSIVQATAEYPHEYCCALGKDNVFATQFHPEKSADAGLQLLSNFCAWNP